MRERKYTKQELEKYANRRTQLFIDISIALLLGVVASSITIYYLRIESWIGRSIFLLIGTIVSVLVIWFLFVLTIKPYFGDKLVLFPKKQYKK